METVRVLCEGGKEFLWSFYMKCIHRQFFHQGTIITFISLPFLSEWQAGKAWDIN